MAPAQTSAAGPAPAAHLAFCDTECPGRASCALRQGFAHLAKGYRVVAEGHPPEQSALMDEALAGAEPLLLLLEQERDACALDRSEAHEVTKERARQEKERILPLVDAIVKERLGGDLAEIKSMLTVLSFHHDAPPAEEGEADRTPPPDDETALRLIQEYRSRYPEDDAEAVRRLLAETRVGLNQVSRLTGWSKSNLSYWKNTSRKAKTGLNKEAPPAEAPESEGPEAAPDAS